MSKSKNATDYLTDKEKDLVKVFIENEPLVEAVRKVISDGILNQGVQKKGKESHHNRNWIFGLDANGILTDDQFGRAARVHAEALVLLERSFNNMELVLPDPEPIESPLNEAR